MSDPLLEEMRLIRASQSRIETAVLGDAELGVPGLVKRVGTVEGKVKTMQNERLKLIGMVGGASFVLSLAATYLFGH